MRRALVGANLAVAVALLLGSAVVADRARSARSSEFENDVKYVPRGDVLRLLTAGYSELAADFYWLRTITYYGEWRQGDHGIEFFRELLSTVVTLDPNFTEAYRFGAVVLADDMGRPGDGIELLEQGMRVMPLNWWLPFEAGFLEYTVRADDEAAYRWFVRAARMPDAPDIPRRFAAFVASRAGELELGYELWRFVAETTDNEAMREKAEEYMQELKAAIEGTGPVPEWARRHRSVQRGTRPAEEI